MPLEVLKVLNHQDEKDVDLLQFLVESNLKFNIIDFILNNKLLINTMKSEKA